MQSKQLQGRRLRRQGKPIEAEKFMTKLVLSVGSCTAQGVRDNNEDNLIVDLEHHLFLVADGMGGQESGEKASGLAVEIIPQVVQNRLAAHDQLGQAIRRAMEEANRAIIAAGKGQPEGRRMGTTAVLAVHHQDQVVVGSLGDSRAYLIRGDEVTQLTIDHSVAQALVATGALTPEEARVSPYQHVLHKFLGCTNLNGGPDLYPFTPRAGDRLILATDGLTGKITEDDLRYEAREFPDVQTWADHLVQLALDRGSRDNVTCIVLAFHAE
jgi:protein phosphatase